MKFSFTVTRKDSRTRARAGVLRTPHGKVQTPVFMPVGTMGAVKALSPDDLKAAGAQIILGNAYYLYLRPGDVAIQKLGGLHRFMGWDGPLLTDSGGYQVSSLGSFREDGESILSRIDDDGVTFRSHLDGSEHRLTPEDVIVIQRNLGADIIMAFDEATPPRGKRYAQKAMERTHRWLKRSIERWRELQENRGRGASPQALFGIIQGGNYKDLRRESAEFVVPQDLPGIAIGGASIGKSPDETRENVDWVYDLLVHDRPLYLMGVGVNPQDVVAAIESGADLFDCVAPTRLARMGHLYFGKLQLAKRKWAFESEFRKGRMNIGNARFRLDKKPIQEDCGCYTCIRGFSRAYLHHLFKSRELLYYRLASIHNVRFMIRLTEVLRKVILE
ncbi:tRNA guanosine(34) transglycosylase Tgt [Patescibacteria group bacterium]|nr:tRNA guanosine(34) transglycosylase Tgt [Patescibacteria group bacterium]